MSEVKKRLTVVAPQGNQNAPMLCGPDCACGKETKTGKWKIVIMLIVLAGVAIAFRTLFRDNSFSGLWRQPVMLRRLKGIEKI